MIKTTLKKIYRKVYPNKYNQIIDISNDFIYHLCYVNSGFLHRGNLYLIDYAIKNLPKNTVIVEVGVFCGLSTNIIDYYRNINNKATHIIFNTDIWKLYTYSPTSNVGNSSISHESYRSHLISTYKHNISFFAKNQNIHTFEMDSDSFFESWNKNKSCQDIWDKQVNIGGEIGFAYIDGSHLYEQAKKDFINTDLSLAKGGFILFDDSADDVFVKNDCEVSLLMKEIVNNYSNRYEVVAKNPNYLIRKIA